MKRLLFIAILLSLCSTNYLIAVPTAGSIVFSDSYLMRAYGSEALYWNPANLSRNYHDMIFPGMNQSFHAANNSFNIDDYNFISGRYLTNKDKNKILSKIDKRLMIDANTNLLMFGLTFGNLAFATSIHAQCDFKLSEDYVKLALMGNGEDDYTFSKRNNQLNLLSYQDYTIGAGDMEISHFFKNDNIPEIKFGFSSSALVGIATAVTESYHGSFHSDFDGMAFKQDIRVKTGVGGLGSKSLVSFVSQPYTNLDLGLSFDNIFGFINWFGKNQRISYTVFSDTTYASDLEDDIITQKDSTVTIKGFTTKIPVEMRWGSKYRYKNMSFSCDWVQGFKNSALTSSIGRISLGSEYQPIRQLPIRIGFRFGNRDYPWGMSYGLGYYGQSIDLGIGIQTFESILPGNNAKGMSLSSNMSIHY